MNQGLRAEQFTCVINGSLSSQEEPQDQKYKGRVVLRSDIVKMIQDLTQYSLSKDHQHLK